MSPPAPSRRSQRELTEIGLKRKLSALGNISDGQRKAVACSLIGHSKIVTTFFGYVYCGRCDAQIGDTLAGSFDLRERVVSGHDCEQCRKVEKTLTWRDRFMAEDPFAGASERRDASILQSSPPSTE